MQNKNKKFLEKENLELKKKLLIAKTWMKKAVENQVYKICKTRVKKEKQEERYDFLNKNIESCINHKIYSFFGNSLLVNTPSESIENLVLAEINYYNFRKNPKLDGFSVISAYHKSLDSIIESFITKDFRVYAKDKIKNIEIINDALEKFLGSVINTGYMLGIGRLYHISEIIIDREKQLLPISRCFRDFSQEYSYIANSILDESFHNKFKKLIETEVFGKKRHSGRISFVETRKARELLVGDFEDKNCIFYKLIEIGKGC